MTLSLPRKHKDKLTRLKEMRIRRAKADLAAAQAASSDAKGRVRLAKATFESRKAQKARNQRRIYREMMLNGIHARALDAMDVVFSSMEAEIARAESAIVRADLELSERESVRQKASHNLQTQQKAAEIWAEACSQVSTAERRTMTRADDRRQEELSGNASWRGQK